MVQRITPYRESFEEAQIGISAMSADLRPGGELEPAF